MINDSIHEVRWFLTNWEKEQWHHLLSIWCRIKLLCEKIKYIKVSNNADNQTNWLKPHNNNWNPNQVFFSIWGRNTTFYFIGEIVTNQSFPFQDENEEKNTGIRHNLFFLHPDFVHNENKSTYISSCSSTNVTLSLQHIQKEIIHSRISVDIYPFHTTSEFYCL